MEFVGVWAPTDSGVGGNFCIWKQSPGKVVLFNYWMEFPGVWAPERLRFGKFWGVVY